MTKDYMAFLGFTVAMIFGFLGAAVGFSAIIVGPSWTSVFLTVAVDAVSAFFLIISIYLEVSK